MKNLCCAEQHTRWIWIWLEEIRGMRYFSVLSDSALYFNISNTSQSTHNHSRRFLLGLKNWYHKPAVRSTLPQKPTIHFNNKNELHGSLLYPVLLPEWEDIKQEIPRKPLRQELDFLHLRLDASWFFCLCLVLEMADRQSKKVLEF